MSAGFWVVAFLCFFAFVVLPCAIIGAGALGRLFDWWTNRSTERMVRREMKERGVRPREIEEIMRKSPVR